jgi:septum site-determining protein MinD
MGKAITIHSYRGGTGKTSVAANIAACLAQSGKTTCLLDFDFRAPSLNTMFRYEPEDWVNDYLEGRCEIDSVLVDFSDKLGLKGKLLLGFANPDVNVAREMMEKGKKWHLTAFQRIMKAKEDLLGNGVDYLILDTSPGVVYSAVNAIVASEDIIVVTTTYMSDLEGISNLISGVYELLEKNASILVNKVAPEVVTTDKGNRVRKWLEEEFKLNVIGLIPCYCEVLNFDGRLFEEPSTVFILEQPEHPFAKGIEEIAEKLW